MSLTRTATTSVTRSATATYTDVDVENVMRRLKADLIMIADSTGAWTAEEVVDYVHDIEVLAKAGYLASVDVTLLSFGIEQRAIRFEVDTNADSWKSSRPGGVLWPRVAAARLRVVVRHTKAYTRAAQEVMKSRLWINWEPSYDDTSHAGLTSSGGRDYASHAYGMGRKDWGT
jgi:hypothetical protein